MDDVDQENMCRCKDIFSVIKRELKDQFRLYIQDNI